MHRILVLVLVLALAEPARALMSRAAPLGAAPAPGFAAAGAAARMELLSLPAAAGAFDLGPAALSPALPAPAAWTQAAPEGALRSDVIFAAGPIIENKLVGALPAPAGQVEPLAPQSRFAATQESLGAAQRPFEPLRAASEQGDDGARQAALPAAFDGARRPEGDATAAYVGQGAPQLTIAQATEKDLDDIVRMVREASLDEMGKDSGGYARTGFLTPDDPAAYYGAQLKNPHAHLIVVRDEMGRNVAFSLYFTKGIIGDPRDPAWELHALVAGEIERRYGPDQDIIIYAHAVVARGVHGGGIGKRMFGHVLADARRRGIDFLIGRIVDDRYLDGTVLEDQPHRLNNAASRGAFTTLPGVVRIMERFVSSREIEAFQRDGSTPRLGVHNWQAFGVSFDPAKPIPSDLPTPPANVPPAKP